MTGRDARATDARDLAPLDERALQRRLDHARALLAASTTLDASSPTLGSVLLTSDQRETVRRVRAHLRRDGGCVLADDVGTGKTYVALAAARDWTRPLIVVPASLRSTWERSARRAEVHCVLATHETLSRARAIDLDFDGIVVDESHRFRPTSRRHAVLATLAARAPLLMVSATPMQNRTRELAAQLALFLGELAYELEPAQLTRWVVRSAPSVQLALPRVRPSRWLPVDADDADVLRELLALPPPPRAADAGDGGVLLQLSLVRAWASSRAALIATVQRRQRTLAAIEQCHQEGRLPTRRELRSWTGSGDVQLGFPTLLASSVMDEERRAALTRAIERERSALGTLLRTIGGAADPDAMRLEALRAVRRAHAGESILAFSEWRSTVHAYWLALRQEPGVGMLCAREARIASGKVTRDELLARFAPRAQGVRVPAAHERVTLLLATDLLSEGVNVQDASVVVHLDLPWNPARLAQRLGRIRRPGGADDVGSYLMALPARAAVLLQVEARLRAKLARAERMIGKTIDVLPALGAASLAAAHGDHEQVQDETMRTPWSAAEVYGEIARRLACWHSAAELPVVQSGDASGIVAAVRADSTGWIALLGDGRLVASHGYGELSASPSESPETILRALELAGGAPRCPRDAERDDALGALDAWIVRDWTQRSSGLEVANTPTRRRMRRALDQTMRVAPRHRRAVLVRSAAIVRAALALPLPLGVERALNALAEEWSRFSSRADAALLSSRASVASPLSRASVASRGIFDWINDAAAVLARAPVGTSAPSERAPSDCRALILFGDDADG